MKVKFRQISFEGTTRELRELMEHMSQMGELDSPVQVQQLEQQVYSDVQQEETQDVNQNEVLQDDQVVQQTNKRRKRR